LAVGAALVVCVPLACSAKHPGLGVDDSSDDGGTLFPGDDGSTSFGDDAGIFTSDGSAPPPGDNGPCKGGFYEGQFGGLYSSHLAGFLPGVAFNLPVTGDVRLTLEQMTSTDKGCQLHGEVPVPCSDVFTVKNGSISGVADAIHTADASFAGFPYYCTLTGTLGCQEKKLVDGWIECVYCVGPLDPNTHMCSLLPGDLTGGHFAGPLTADYFYTSVGDGGAGGPGSGPPAFGTDCTFGTSPLCVLPPYGNDPGAWNGAEDLCPGTSATSCYSGMGPLPDGGTVSDYLSDAGYGMLGTDAGAGRFGGYGWWWATYQHP
jgi:hypothetical protein